MIFNIYIDESGTPNLNAKDQSRYFTLTGVVINQARRLNLANDFGNLKKHYFGKKNYILHGVSVRGDLEKNNKNLESFSKDFQRLANKHPFFILSTSVDKNKAIQWSWRKTTILKRSYRSILKHLIIFLIGKNISGGIVAEASSVEKDIEIYKGFFNFIAHGIPSMNISSLDIKKHLTSVSYVTKNNNDPEEQISDLLGICGKIKYQLDKQEIRFNDLDALDKALCTIWEKKLFNGKSARSKNKIRLYRSMKGFDKLP